MNKVLVTLASVACMIAPSSIAAQSADVAISVALSVQDGCVFDSDNLRLDFGQFQNPSASAGDTVFVTTAGTESSVIVQCNADMTNATLTIDGGLNPAGDLRRMRNSAVPAGDGGEFAGYRVYLTTDRDQAAPDREIGINIPFLINQPSPGDVGNRFGTGISVLLPVSASTVLSNNLAAGHYSDDLFLTFAP